MRVEQIQDMDGQQACQQSGVEEVRHAEWAEAFASAVAL